MEINEEILNSFIKEIILKYEAIFDKNNEIIKNAISEQIISNFFASFLTKKDDKLSCFSEMTIKNNFKNFWKKIEEFNNKKVLIKNNIWKIDTFIFNNINNNIWIFEFKIGKYTISDLLRSIILLLKVRNVESIHLIYSKDKKIKVPQNKKFIFSCIDLKINDNIFSDLIKILDSDDEQLLNDYNKDTNLIKKLKKNIDEKFENENFNWRMIKIQKNTTIFKNSISEKENFGTVGLFVNSMLKTEKKTWQKKD